VNNTLQSARLWHRIHIEIKKGGDMIVLLENGFIGRTDKKSRKAKIGDNVTAVKGVKTKSGKLKFRLTYPFTADALHKNQPAA